MNQIPEGEFCDNCPCLNIEADICDYYVQGPDSIAQNYYRLPICLKERPQIVKEGTKNERNM